MIHWFELVIFAVLLIVYMFLSLYCCLLFHLKVETDAARKAIAVPEEAILQAVEDAARDDGFLFCPEGGAVLAAWRQALDRGMVGRQERVLLFNCANGNKYPLPDRSRRLRLAEAKPETL